ADAVAHVEELVDPEVIHQPELVVGERLPGVVDRHGAGRLAAIGVALVHRDAAEVVLKCFHRVDHRVRPIADAGVQAPTGGDQQREAGARLLVADADVALVIKRHGSLSLQSVDAGDARAATSRARPWSRRAIIAHLPSPFCRKVNNFRGLFAFLRPYVATIKFAYTKKYLDNIL